jgi:hypothetical protein
MVNSHLSPRLRQIAERGTLATLAAFLFFVDLFLPWSGQCNAIFTPFNSAHSFSSTSGHQVASVICTQQVNGWGGAGTVAGVLAGLLFIWEATRVARVDVRISPGYRSLLSSALAFGVLVFTVIQIVALLTWMSSQLGPLQYGGTFAWIALALAVLIGLVGVVHWAIWDEQAPSALPKSRPPTPADSVTIPPAASESAPWTRVCPACAHENPEDARFCAACGQNLEAPPPRRRSTRRTPPSE